MLINHANGAMLDIEHLTPEAVDAAAIGHCLSSICRFNGATTHFYSVAQHCLFVSMLVPARLQLAALVHDASEAYVTDLPSPIKHDSRMAWYRDLERRVQSVIETHFGLQLTERDRREIKEADEIMLATEASQLLPKEDYLWPLKIARPAPFIITPVLPKTAEQLWLTRLNELLNGAAAAPADAPRRARRTASAAAAHSDITKDDSRTPTHTRASS